MDGVTAALGPCVRCGQYFWFDVDRVPSIVIDGVRRPICEPCVPEINRVRKRIGEPLIVPLPGAYVTGREW